METSFVKVADIMRTSLHFVGGIDSIKDAIEQMKQHEVSSLVIERRHDSDEYGLLTVHDIAAKVVAVNSSTERTSVYEIMTKPAMTLSGDMNVKYAIRLLARLELTRALVVGDRGLLGLVTLRDLVLSYSEVD